MFLVLSFWIRLENTLSVDEMPGSMVVCVLQQHEELLIEYLCVTTCSVSVFPSNLGWFVKWTGSRALLDLDYKRWIVVISWHEGFYSWKIEM